MPLNDKQINHSESFKKWESVVDVFMNGQMDLKYFGNELLNDELRLDKFLLFCLIWFGFFV